MSFWFFHFGWIKKRKIRIAIKREVEILQVRIVKLYSKINYQKSTESELAVIAKEYEEVVRTIEQHISFLAITQDVN